MAKRARLQVVGLNELVRDLRKAGQVDLLDALKKAHEEAAKVVEDAARPKSPIRSGNLQASLRSSGTRKAGVVRLGKASVPYAGPIHFGWPARGIRPQPFIYEAVDARRGEVLAVFEKRMKDVTDQDFGIST